MQTWRLIRDKNYDGLTNMAKDEAISIACGEKKSPATLRLYGWKTPTISIGYSQRTEDDINLQYCNSAGIDIVRRPTGGRAVLHENELTFSFNASVENPLFPKNILKSHKKISEALLLGLHRLGINAKLQYKSKNRQSRNQIALPPWWTLRKVSATKNTNFISKELKEIHRVPRATTKWSYRSETANKTLLKKHSFASLLHRNPVCFSTPSLYELVVDGKKIVGCAQRRFRNSFLEHGSIPLKLDRHKLSSIFRNGLSFSEKKIESLCFENMAGLNELGLCSFSLDQLIENFLKGFENRFEITFKEDTLSDYEIGLMRKIRTQTTKVNLPQRFGCNH